MRAAVTSVAGLVLLACQVLPSAVPLADTGGSSASVAGTGSDRRADAADVGSGGEAPTQEVVVQAEEPKPAASSADAGPSDALPSAPAADEAPSWPGEYVGSDRLVRKFDEGPDDVQLDDKARTRVEQPNSSAVTISIINSASGDVICALRASVSGNRATLEPGQTCFGEEDYGALISAGHATLDGDRLVVEFEASVEESESPGERDSYHFDGTRR